MGPTAGRPRPRYRDPHGTVNTLVRKNATVQIVIPIDKKLPIQDYKHKVVHDDTN